MEWLNFFRGIYYSLLPKDYWGQWRPSSTVDFACSALVSGLLECGVCLCLLGLGYWRFLLLRTRQLAAASGSNEGTQLYFLFLVSIEYVFHPLTLIGIVLAGEGALRAWAALFADEIIPSFPIRLLAFIQRRQNAKKETALLGEPVPDLCERTAGEDGELRIHSQRPKEGWRESISVAVDGEFYEISRVENVAGLRPFLYVLQKLPAGRIIRGAYRYDQPF